VTSPSYGLLAVAGAVFVVLAIGLVMCISSLVRGNRQDLLASAPVVGESEITLSSAGEVTILIETPRTSADFRAFQIQLLEKKTGQISTMTYSYVTAQGAVYGVSMMQVPFGRFAANAGDYFVRVSGLRPGQDYSSYKLIVSRPYMGRMVLQIIGIVLCGVGMLGSVIWSAWLAGLMQPR
jgi:hypothetical protein